MKHKVKHIHFVGIGGSGMSGIAEVLLNLGYTVSGSDLSHNTATRRQFTTTQQDRVLAGLPPHEVGFATIELHNIHRIPLREVRRALVRLGIENRWIRDMVTIAPRTMELVVFQEKVEDIRRLLEPTKLRIETETVHDRLFTTDTETLKATEKRLERQLERLHDRMVMVRRHLSDLYDRVISEIASRNDISDNEF